MAITDTLAGTLKIDLKATLTRINDGDVAGTDVLAHSVSKTITNSVASCWLNETVTVTTGATTISLADSADPFAAIGDEIPTKDPEAGKIICLMIENLDTTNYVTVGVGANALTSILGGTSPTVKLPAGAVVMWYSPAGWDVINDGVDDEITLQANVASCEVKISVLYLEA